MQKVYFSLDISAEQYLAFYRGQAKFVQVVADNGQLVRFPAEILRDFVSRDGVSGKFVLEFDEQNKYRKLQRI